MLIEIICYEDVCKQYFTLLIEYPSLQGLTHIEEMLISAVLPIMSLYKLTVCLQWTHQLTTRRHYLCQLLTTTAQ